MFAGGLMVLLSSPGMGLSAVGRVRFARGAAHNYAIMFKSTSLKVGQGVNVGMRSQPITLPKPRSAGVPRHKC
jgi:hypothetical protein